MNGVIKAYVAIFTLLISFSGILLGADASNARHRAPKRNYKDSDLQKRDDAPTRRRQRTIKTLLDAVNFCEADGVVAYCKRVGDKSVAQQVNQPFDDMGMTPFLFACQNKSLEIVSALLNHGAAADGETCVVDGTIISVDRESPLTVAVQAGNRAVVKQLINAKANVNQPAGGNLYSPLYWAAFRGDCTIATMLLEAGADINVLNRFGSTPLMTACSQGNKEMVFLLLENECDVHLVNAAGKTALSIAKKVKSLKLPKL